MKDVRKFIWRRAQRFALLLTVPSQNIFQKHNSKLTLRFRVLATCLPDVVLGFHLGHLHTFIGTANRVMRIFVLLI